jgi:uncharacterized protein
MTLFALFAAQPGAQADLTAAQAAFDRKDYAAAFREFSSAAEQGDALAQSSLGAMYDRGLGVARDFEAAVQWFRRSAEQGNKFGQFNLGAMYFMGTGVAQDRIEGCKWFSLALMQGSELALYNMQLCGKYLDEAARAEYNRRAQEWLASHNGRQR